MSLFAILVTATAGWADDHPSAEGFYPIWENTGYIDSHRALYIGTNGAHFAFNNTAQIGVQPVNFLYRTPNIYAKYSLHQQNKWHISTQIGAFYLMEMASRATFSPTYTSRLDNPDFDVLLLPVSFNATKEISDWLQLHQTLTALTILTRGQLENETFFGYSAVAEMKARARNSFLVHFSEIGFWNHDETVLGTSYRYQGDSYEFRLGYFYRMRPGSSQSSPLIGLGWFM